MKIHNNIIGAVLLSTFAFVNAQGTPVTSVALENIIPTKTEAVLLARVDLYKPTLTKNTKNKQYGISFTLKTEDPIQKDIRYRVVLLNEEERPVYTYAFPDSVTLVKHIPVSLTKSFPVPIDISGTYTVAIHVVNKEGLPLATGRIENMAFQTEISPSLVITTCNQTSPVYDKQETVTVTCSLKNQADLGSAISYTIHKGNRVQSYSDGVLPITDKKFTLSFKAPARADSYTLSLQATKHGALVGETYTIPFAVRGEVSNILSLFVNAQSYKKGERALVNAGLNIFSEQKRAVYAEATMTQGDTGLLCGPVVRTKLTTSGSVAFSIPITETCNGFDVSVRLLDDRGIVLDEDMLRVQKDRTARFIGFLNTFLILASILILTSAFIHKRHART